MSWLRLDDGFAQHPKIVALTPRDRWTWLELLCYCARYRTDGRVPAGIADVVRGATTGFLQRCGQLRLLDADPASEGGFLVHDWLDYNPLGLEGDELDNKVAAAMVAHPEASANDIVRLLGTRRGATLQAIRRFRAGTTAGSATGTQEPDGNQSGTGTRAGAQARTRPVPSPELPAAAAGTTPAEPEPPEPNDAAAARQALETLGIDPGLADHLGPDLVLAWTTLATTEAHANPAGFVVAGLRTGQPPSPRANGTPPATDPSERRQRFVRGDGHRLPTDELDYQLTQMGADDDERMALLDLAADLQRGATT